MIIQIISLKSDVVKTITVEEVQNDEVLVYWPCWYCGNKLVRLPAKFCCEAHRVYYHRKDIASALS